jgi:hypothetical protein
MIIASATKQSAWLSNYEEDSLAYSDGDLP